jgi:hypothetical protein
MRHATWIIGAIPVAVTIVLWLIDRFAVEARVATLFAQGLQTRGPLELDLGDRIGSLSDQNLQGI